MNAVWEGGEGHDGARRVAAAPQGQISERGADGDAVGWAVQEGDIGEPLYILLSARSSDVKLMF